MDVGNTFAIPNAYGLLPSDFDFDMDGYRSALAFLGDLATGSDHDEALTSNGANRGMLVGWQKSDKFRRVYAKCKAAGIAEQEALRRAEGAPKTTEGEGAPEPQGQRFIPLEEAPVVRGVFGYNPPRDAWGEG